jgi:hypothetical protein
MDLTTHLHWHCQLIESVATTGLHSILLTHAAAMTGRERPKAVNPNEVLTQSPLADTSIIAVRES